MIGYFPKTLKLSQMALRFKKIKYHRCICLRQIRCQWPEESRHVISCCLCAYNQCMCCSPDSKYKSTSTQSNILVGFKNRLLHKLPAFSLHSLMPRVAVCNIQQTVMSMKHISDFQPRLIFKSQSRIITVLHFFL